MADPAKKQSLIREIQEARGQVAGNIVALKQDLSIGNRFRRSVRENPLAWYGSAALIGLLLSKIPPMGKKVVVPRPIFAKEQKAGKAAMILGAIKIALDLGRPLIINWLKERASNRPPMGRTPRPRPVAVSRVR
jgi:hypothetical protein